MPTCTGPASYPVTRWRRLRIGAPQDEFREVADASANLHDVLAEIGREATEDPTIVVLRLSHGLEFGARVRERGREGHAVIAKKRLVKASAKRPILKY